MLGKQGQKSIILPIALLLFLCSVFLNPSCFHRVIRYRCCLCSSFCLLVLLKSILITHKVKFIFYQPFTINFKVSLRFIFRQPPTWSVMYRELPCPLLLSQRPKKSSWRTTSEKLHRFSWRIISLEIYTALKLLSRTENHRKVVGARSILNK